MAVRGFRLGGGATDQITDGKSAFAEYSGAGTRYMTLEHPAGTDYQVTTGKTFYVTEIQVSASSAPDFELGYGDDGVANGTSAPTNYVAVSPLHFYDANNKIDRLNCFIPIPADKYPCGRSTQGDPLAMIYGFEV